MCILDTDHLSHLAWGEGSRAVRLMERLSTLPPDEVATTIISYEEQTRGWLAFMAKARTQSQIVEAYLRLSRHLENFRRTPVLPFDELAATKFAALKRDGVRIGLMDLRIASIVLARKATLLSCNRADFRKVSGLHVEDWTI